MAECDVSIDKNKLPGVKEVCKDFAVLEDHCLAYNLQEQEIESHLASNVNKSRLVQKDLQVAKKLQEEEDLRAKGHTQKKHIDIERQDNEIAQEIQDQLVRQAEHQRLQEEKDAAIARKLQEKEMKEERKRQKQLEANFEEEYFEDHGAARPPPPLPGPAARKPLDLDEPAHRDYSPEYSSAEPKRSRYPRQDPAGANGRPRYPEHHPPPSPRAEGGRSRHAEQYAETLSPSRGGRHGDRYADAEPAETGRARGPGGEDTDRAVRKKDKPARPPPPKSPMEREGRRDRGRDLEWERRVEKEPRRDREQDPRGGRARDRERSRDGGLDGPSERDWHRPKDKDGQRARTRSRERGLEEEPGHRRGGPSEGRASWEEAGGEGEREGRARGRQRVLSGPEDVFDVLDKHDGAHSHPNGETGRIVHRVSGAVISEAAYGVSEATKDLTKLDIREQELKDLEVARKLQEEEIKANKGHVRTAQVAQDEEIARLLMEREKKEYRKNRERENEREREKEKERERERERLAMEKKAALERRRLEGDYRPSSEEVVRPRTREEHEYQRQRERNHKPARPPQPPGLHDYENVNSGYGYSDHPAAPRNPSRPEAAYKGGHHRR
ncbi:coiled-coil domain-containing protein 50 isoform X1 [Pungitius pungitius]|uniref:coiled-coil domain-containing protein 50 isoform X1 n=1 Tax=Pungitius pungitius TaxID=134920 RepID=UPI002E1568C0